MGKSRLCRVTGKFEKGRAVITLLLQSVVLPSSKCHSAFQLQIRLLLLLLLHFDALDVRDPCRSHRCFSFVTFATSLHLFPTGTTPPKYFDCSKDVPPFSFAHTLQYR